MLRHALALGLSACAAPERLAELVPGEAVPLQLLRVLALRRQRHPALAVFLRAESGAVAAEAARAIHDVPVPEAWPDLAACLEHLPAAGADDGLPAAHGGGPQAHDDVDALVRRALSVHERLGGPWQARGLAAFAANTDQRAAHRALALEMLAEWPESGRRDRLLGFHQPVLARAPAPLDLLARELHEAGLANAPPELARPWVRLCATAGAADLAPALTALLDAEARAAEVRIEALVALARLVPPDLPAIVDRTLSARDARLRAEALVALEALSPAQALPRLPALLEAGELLERRAAYQMLGRAPAPAGPVEIDPDALLLAQLARLQAGLHPVELQLDLVLAAEARAAKGAAEGAAEGEGAAAHPQLAAALERLRAPRGADPEVGPFLDALFGGERDAGRAVYDSPALSCGKCHARDEWGSQAVGPSLEGVGQRLSRVQLAESILSPNRRTAPGFGSELIFLRDGSALSGRVTSERDGQLCVQQHDGGRRWVPVADVELRRAGISAMPEGLGAGLTREQMRDLLEYLASL
jgi:putative heme-binding domain-containing protein